MTSSEDLVKHFRDQVRDVLADLTRARLHWSRPEADQVPAASTLSAWERTATALGDPDFAGFLASLHQRSVSARLPCRIELTSLAGRHWRIEMSDELAPSLVPGTIIDSGHGHEIACRELPQGSYNVLVFNSQGQPDCRVPILATGDTQSVSMAHGPPLPNEFRPQFLWIPQSRGVVGGDLLARNSLPEQAVDFGNFYVSRYHLSMDHYLTLGGAPSDGQWHGRGLYDSEGSPLDFPFDCPPSETGYLPVVGLDLPTIRKFLESLNTPDGLHWDLLTSLEWEALMCGPEGYAYPWGDHYFPGLANVREYGAAPALRRVGSYSVDTSRWGLYDGAGNAEEWTVDLDDTWPVARGGSWYNDKQMARTGSLIDRTPDYRHPKLGFRLILRAV